MASRTKKSEGRGRAKVQVKGQMSPLWEEGWIPVSLTFGDIHASHEAPVARKEKGQDWYGVIRRQFDQVENIWIELGCPFVLCAGDIFHDGWREKKCPPELINFIMDQFGRFKKRVYAILGQHDLPHHQLKDLNKSAFWTLVKAGVINYHYGSSVLGLYPGPIAGNVLVHLSGYPWSRSATPYRSLGRSPHVKIAIVHDYCWAAGHGFPNAPLDKHYEEHRKRFPGYNVIVFGDNHKDFMVTPVDDDMPIIVNGGGFIPRNTDERDRVPKIGLIEYNPTEKETRVRMIPLDTSEDQWEPVTEEIKLLEQAADPKKLKEFIAKLEEGNTVAIDFAAELIRQAADPSVRKFLVQILDKAKDK